MTVRFAIVVAAAPRKLTWLWGIASAVPGAGLTSSGVFGRTAEASRVLGRQLGEGAVAAACAACAAIAAVASVKRGEREDDRALAATPRVCAACTAHHRLVTIAGRPRSGVGLPAHGPALALRAGGAGRVEARHEDARLQ